MQENIGKYIPGVCNIGPAEIAMRKRLGWYGLIAAFVVWALFRFFGIPSLWCLVIFIPIFFSANGFLQGYMHFCAGFGMRGLFNFGPQVGKTDTVSQAEFRAADRKKAQQIFIYATLIAIAVTFIAVLFG